MEFRQIMQQGLKVKRMYRDVNDRDNHHQWEASEYLQGLMGDVGDLAKLIMAKNNFRYQNDIDAKLSHELADCLWSIIALADELQVDLEAAFTQTMSELQQRLDTETSSA